MFATIGKSALALGASVAAGTLGIAVTVDAYDAVKKGATKAYTWATASTPKKAKKAKKSKAKAKAKAKKVARRDPSARPTRRTG
jgi:hypothetical protein